MNKIIINSPAKINIGLNVIEKRPDGYHNIETIFYPLNLHDEITYIKSDSFSFESNVKTITNDADNLIIKSLKKIEDFTGQKFPLKIILKKNIPLGSGMGGGSSNAASTLLSVNELYNLNIEKNDLNRLALEIGSDVPFFLEFKPKYALSRGEVLSDINLEINQPILIVNPGIHISTKWAYGNVKPKKPDISLQSVFQKKINNFSELKGLIINDFEEPVFDKFPEIGEIKSQLYFTGASFALMTGSGSTLFGIYRNLEEAEKAEAVFKKKYYTFINF